MTEPYEALTSRKLEELQDGCYAAFGERTIALELAISKRAAAVLACVTAEG